MVLTHQRQHLLLDMFLVFVSDSVCFYPLHFIQLDPDSPSGLTPLTFLSQPHLSSSPRVQALVTATAMAAEDRACTKAASRVPESKREMQEFLF